jgi:hypothetical protein
VMLSLRRSCFGWRPERSLRDLQAAGGNVARPACSSY